MSKNESNIIQIKSRSKNLHIRKSITGIDYESKTVLTNSSWEYVELWLQRNKESEALMYWKQAKQFYDASMFLPVDSRPLTAYYCCMNAAKALLSCAGIATNNIRHGVISEIKAWNSNSIKDAMVKYQKSGVLSELTKHFSEPIGAKEYSVYDLLYNIPCVHRAFVVTFRTPIELFIPVSDTGYFVNTDTNDAWVQICFSKDFETAIQKNQIPAVFEEIKNSQDNGECVLRYKETFKWFHNKHLSAEEKEKNKREISDYQLNLRKHLHYLKGNMNLWYLKKYVDKCQLINRNSITLIYGVFHWLSELVRYDPAKFYRLQSSKQYWLLHEFIETALQHYVDEISCEITKTDILTPGYRGG